MSTSYDRVAPLYDLLGALYSAGAIARSKKEHLKFLHPGQRVLYVGAGTGRECVDAAALGAQVTICDTSERMLQRARSRLESAQLPATYVGADALTLSATFDVIVAPYFLNVFDSRRVLVALSALSARLSPGGMLYVVDFRAPTGGLFFRGVQRLYYLLPQLLFLVLTKNPWHELYDYPKLAESAAPELTLTKRVCTRAVGLPLLETICFEKTRPQ